MSTTNGDFPSKEIKEGEVLIADFRSDTVTLPSENMKKAMYAAQLGDDVYAEDPTVKILQDQAASMVGKEAALFVPSGTMSNLIAMMVHCDVRGSEAYCGDSSHIIHHEQAGASQIGGILLRTLKNKDDGTFNLAELDGLIRKNPWIHSPISKLICVENTINGKILPLVWLQAVSCFAKKYNLAVHMDGARVWNAVVASQVSIKDIAATCDSLSFCLSKGLGAPIGSLLCGSKEFILKALRIRKVLGGAMRQVGVVAAAGIVALKESISLLKEDHRRTTYLAHAIIDLNSELFSVNLHDVQTNMIFVNVNSDQTTAEQIVKKLGSTDSGCRNVIVKCMSLSNNKIRIVLHRDISDIHVDATIYKIKYVLKSLSQ